jgi:hypothetical protein
MSHRPLTSCSPTALTARLPDDRPPDPARVVPSHRIALGHLPRREPARPSVEHDRWDLPFGPWGHACVAGIVVGGIRRAEDSDVAADSSDLSRTQYGLRPWRYLILVVLVLAGVSYALGDPDPWWTSDAELLVLVGGVVLGSVPVLLAAAALAVLFPTRTLVRVGADLTAGTWTGVWALWGTGLRDLIGSSTVPKGLWVAATTTAAVLIAGAWTLEDMAARAWHQKRVESPSG